jgi:hypothetical protein
VAILAESEEFIKEKISGYILHELIHQEWGSSEIARDLPRPDSGELQGILAQGNTISQIGAIYSSIL